MELIESLISNGYLKTPRIIKAFRAIKRLDFLPGYLVQGNTNLESLADLNEALPIGHGQTISQPAVVAFMLELLDPRPGNNILDIGSGSGWTSALLAQIVGDKGRITAVERIPEIYDFGKANIDKYGYVKNGIVQTVCADGSLGLAANAPYDRILASAAANEIPPPWLQQLTAGGIMVAPSGTSIKKFEKDRSGSIAVRDFQGFVFVPLVQSRRNA